MNVAAEALDSALAHTIGAVKHLGEQAPPWFKLGLDRDPGDWPAWTRVAIQFGVKREWWEMRLSWRRAWKLYCEDVLRTGRLDAWPRFES